MVLELRPEELRKTCDPQLLGCSTSEEMYTLETIIGQERAVRALQFGLGIKNSGFNIYVAGPPGTGKTTAIEQFLEAVAKGQPVPGDWCYVNNFEDAYRPDALRLPPGRAGNLQADMKNLIEEAQREIQSAFGSDEYAAKRKEVGQTYQKRRDEIFAAIERQAQDAGFFIQVSPIGLITIPVVKGKPISEEEFLALNDEDRDRLSQQQKKLQDEIQVAVRDAKGLERQANEAFRGLDQEVARFALSSLVDELQEKYQDLLEVGSYLEAVQDDILANLSDFRQEPDEAQPAMALGVPGSKRSPFRKYRVKVLVDNTAAKGAPVIVELNPTYNNLFGRIEQEAQFGTLVTDFTIIREGSLHRANGGYLVLPIEEVLRNPFSWDSLKRALRNQEIVIEDAGEKLGYVATKGLRPEPIPLDVKVVLVGQPLLYHLLLSYDESFGELFKVKADFGTDMDRTPENMRDYVSFVGTICKTESLKHLDTSALAAVVEQGSRLAGDQEKLSTRFGELADLIREASYYAMQDDPPYVSGVHVNRAVEERYYRSSLVLEKSRELIAQNTIMIDVEGTKVGQVNGLSVIDLGDIAFGRPSRITASVTVGEEGVIDIEREAKLGGPIHTKGVLILAGYLSAQFAQDKPLSLSARLVFEQSYAGVEGDSASSSELYTLLSALSGLPIRQGIAVTGSVNQKGQVQAIGGANEKIEGFFEICQAKGLNGAQGVIIPATNVRHLMLKPPVVEAVRDGKFHIWPVGTIDEGMEILTGVRAGMRQEDGSFEPESVNQRADTRLRELAETMRDFAKEELKGS
jgi:lon-related putative ATP-dependent protease